MEPFRAEGDRPAAVAAAPAWRAPCGGAVPVAAVAVLGLAAYANALSGAFVFDDLQHVRDNPLVRELWRVLSPAGLRAFPHRWVAYVTFAVNYRLGGLSPWGYHAFNVAVHLGSAALVFALVALAFRTPRLTGSALAPHARAIAFVAAALFVTHPLQTQAVTYVVQRMTSLAAFLYLAAVVLYLRWRLAPAWGRAARAAAYAGVVVLALLAMKTKEIAFTLPFAIGLAEACFFRPGRRDLLRLLPIAATALVVPATWLLAAGAPGRGVLAAAEAMTRVQTEVSRLDYLATQLAVVVTYLFLLVLPIGQNLDHDYPVYRSFLAPEVLSAALVLAALAGLAAWLLGRTRDGATRTVDPAARLAAFGIAWWFLALSVESSVVPIVDVVNEHRVYLPSAGLLVAAAIGLFAASGRLFGAERGPRRLVVAAAALGIVLGAATFARNRVWASDVALWSDAARKSPEKARPWLNLGTALREAGQPEAAAVALRRGVDLDRRSAYGRSQLGAVLLALGRPAEAEPELRAALSLAGDDPEALFNLGTLLWQLGRKDEARPLYARFAEVAPPAYADARRLARARAPAGASGAPAAAAPPPDDRPPGLR